MKSGAKNIGINRVDADILHACAFRYALGRQTYVVGSVVESIIDAYQNDIISAHMVEIMQKEILEAIKEDQAGMEMDVVQWRRILEL